MTDEHGRGNPQMNGPFFGTVQDTGIAMPALLWISNFGRFLLLRPEEHVLWTDVDTDAATDTMILINDGRHNLFLLTPDLPGNRTDTEIPISKSQIPNKSQISISNDPSVFALFQIWAVGVYLLFGACDLVLLMRDQHSVAI
jgi:hypothetical protein